MKATRFSSKRFDNVSSAISPADVNALWAIANENILGKTLAPRCSKGIRKDQRALLPPPIEGEADISNACFSLNGWGRNLETQSMAFLIKPGIDPLYSGDDIMKASFAKMRLRNSSAPVGCKLIVSESWLKEGQSKSIMFA